jgi:hypothetical protein
MPWLCEIPGIQNAKGSLDRLSEHKLIVRFRRPRKPEFPSILLCQLLTPDEAAPRNAYADKNFLR